MLPSRFWVGRSKKRRVGESKILMRERMWERAQRGPRRLRVRMGGYISTGIRHSCTYPWAKGERTNTTRTSEERQSGPFRALASFPRASRTSFIITTTPRQAARSSPFQEQHFQEQTNELCARQSLATQSKQRNAASPRRPFSSPRPPPYTVVKGFHLPLPVAPPPPPAAAAAAPAAPAAAAVSAPAFSAAYAAPPPWAAGSFFICCV